MNLLTRDSYFLLLISETKFKNINSISKFICIIIYFSGGLNLALFFRLK